MAIELKELREQIENIDSQILPLFTKRMELAQQVAKTKMLHNLAILDSERENQIVENALKITPPQFKSETQLLIRTLLSLSRRQQQQIMFGGQTPMLAHPAQPVTQNIVCAYQGVPGAWAQHAALALFPTAQHQTAETFEDVFLAVTEGKAHYGVVPIENSKTGAIGENYDLLRKYGCFIVGRTWLPIKHCLLGVSGANLSAIREVYSHPEGFKQCSNYLKNKNWDLSACRNTAVAAQIVAEANSPKKAAIGSPLAAKLNGLCILKTDIMDNADNSTSFVVISKHPEYNRSSNLISLTFSTQHHSGALCAVLMPFMAENLNLARIESRPIGGGHYRFFAEIEGNIADETVIAALQQAASASEYFEVLGCYSCTQTQEANYEK